MVRILEGEGNLRFVPIGYQDIRPNFVVEEQFYLPMTSIVRKAQDGRRGLQETEAAVYPQEEPF